MLCQRLEGALRGLNLVQDLPSVVQKDFSLGQQRDAPRGALKQRRAEFALESMELPAERWLRDVQPARRAPNVLFLGDGYEVLKLVQAHGPQPSSRHTQTVLDVA